MALAGQNGPFTLIDVDVMLSRCGGPRAVMSDLSIIGSQVEPLSFEIISAKWVYQRDHQNRNYFLY
jgi:hypothetical protein